MPAYLQPYFCTRQYARETPDHMDNTSRFGLIGYPIGGSLSPTMFKAAYGGRWAYDLIEDPSFDSAWSRFIEGYEGINVTAPYKETACAKADILSEECRAIGATNLLVRRPDGIHAYNSDYRGVRLLLSDIGFGPGCSAVIAGFGGAGKAAAAAAASIGMTTVICNRTVSKAEGIHPLSELNSLAADSDIVIYTLPCLVAEAEGIECRCLLEANYRTPAFAEAPGVDRYIHGREWMLLQAVTGYRLFTGEDPDMAAMIRETAICGCSESPDRSPSSCPQSSAGY